MPELDKLEKRIYNLENKFNSLVAMLSKCNLKINADFDNLNIIDDEPFDFDDFQDDEEKESLNQSKSDILISDSVL